MGIFDSLAGGLGGGILGATIVEVGLDTKSLATGLVSARREVSAASATMGKEASFLRDNWTSFAAVAGVALIKFGADSVKAFEESERSIENLQNAYHGNIDGLLAQSKALQTWSGYSDEAVQSAQAVYARLRLNATQIKGLIPLTLDFARATGQDLPAAASAMSKALLGNTRALKAIGVSSQEFVVTGDRAKDAANLVAVLQQHIGGLARVESSNLDVKMQVLGNEFNDIEEQVGGALVPALANLASGMDTVVTHVNEFIASINAAKNFVGGFADSLKDSFGSLFGALKPIASSLMQIGQIKDDKAFAEALPPEFLKTLESGQYTVDELRTKYQQWLVATKQVTGATDGLTQSQQESTAAAKAQRQATQQLAGGLLGLVATSQQVRQDQRALNSLRQKGRQDTAAYSDAELQLLQDNLSLNDGLREYVQNLKASGSSQQQAINKVAALGRQFGISKGEIRDLISTIYGIRPAVQSAASSFTELSVKAQQAALAANHALSLATQARSAAATVGRQK